MKEWINNYENKLTDWKTEQKTGFDTWFTTLTDQLNVNTYVEQYKNTFTT